MTTGSISVRTATADDYPTLADVMYDAVHRGQNTYSTAQRWAWLPAAPNGPSWHERLQHQTVFVADSGDDLMGFVSLADGGYIDLAFIRPAAQGTGLFRKLYLAAERLAISRGESRMWVHASLTAEPAFSSVGFEIRTRESVTVRDQTLDRFVMEKQLP